jgi:uncharacterized SAM-dependent methyltransferase
VSRQKQSVALAAQRFELDEGESIHTENSYKFTVDSLRALARRAGFKPGSVSTKPQRLFSIHWLHAPRGDPRNEGDLDRLAGSG